MEHLAVIMDGNRRWAKENKVKIGSSHRKGRDAARLAIEFCIANDINYLSLYAFSLENFKRPKMEQNEIFTVLIQGINDELDEFIAQGVHIQFVGDRGLFPSHLMPSIERAEIKTQECTKLHLNILFCYGARQELLNAVQTIAQEVKEGTLDVSDIDQDTLQNALWTAGTPHPDLIVRTSGVTRLSNFLLYQAAYSEFAFLDCHWPEITQEHLEQCVSDFKASRRNFGH